jgi:two-component system, cell cycle response regulator DivK
MVLVNYKILVVDDSKFSQKYIKKILDTAKADVLIANNGKEALEICQNNELDLILSDINMPVMDGFEFIKHLNQLKINIPRVMITNMDIDKYLELAIKNDIGNILSKPVKPVELVTLCHKLITQKGIFGINNYLLGMKSAKRVRIKNSNQIHPTIHIICTDAIEEGMAKENKSYLTVILTEVLINAVYHAHGYTEEKLKSADIRLKEDENVEICFGTGKRKYGISVTDFQGKLTKESILKALKSCVDQEEMIQNAVISGEDISDIITTTGRGLQMIRMMANEYFFNIKRGEKTEVIILVDFEKNEENNKQSSIKINEVY